MDQLCIDQTDENEKVVTAAAMDVIYSSATQVAVLLENVLLSHDEVNTFTHHNEPVDMHGNTVAWAMLEEETQTVTRAYLKIVTGR